MEIDPDYLLKLDLLLSYVKEAGATDAVVAGGAIRDMLLQKPISDIDVFYTGEVKKHAALTKDLTYSPVGYPEGWEVTHQVTCLHFPVKIQLIRVPTTIMEHLETFPSPLCRVLYSQESGLVGVGEFFCYNVRMKQLVIDKKIDGYYLDKLQEKFYDYKTVFTSPGFKPVESPVPF